MAGATWIALLVDEKTRAEPLPKYTHLAFDISASDYPVLVAKLVASGAPKWEVVGEYVDESFYFLDPGYLHARRPEAQRAQIRLDTLADLPDALRASKAGLYPGPTAL